MPFASRTIQYSAVTVRAKHEVPAEPPRGSNAAHSSRRARLFLRGRDHGRIEQTGPGCCVTFSSALIWLGNGMLHGAQRLSCQVPVFNVAFFRLLSVHYSTVQNRYGGNREDGSQTTYWFIWCMLDARLDGLCWLPHTVGYLFSISVWRFGWTRSRNFETVEINHYSSMVMVQRGFPPDGNCFQSLLHEHRQGRIPDSYDVKLDQYKCMFAMFER